MSRAELDNPFRENRLNVDRDFRPEWDVPGLNADVSTHLVQEIRRLKGRRKADPGQMIPVLLSGPGYGKTHLFGRVSHLLNEEVLFVFVPALEERTEPLNHIVWHAVESLFQARPGAPSPLARALARLCQASFIDYFERLPPSLAARHQQVRQQLQEGAGAALEIIGQVRSIEPFLRLADSISKSMPEQASDVVRALALGWAPEPWCLHARRWLRGEDLPEAEIEALGLGDDPPTPLKVLRAIPAIFGYEMPLVICCDQLEAVIRTPQGAINFTNALVEILQDVPSQITLSCLEGDWPEVFTDLHSATQQRVRRPWFELHTLRDDQAVELVRRRIQTWPGKQPERGELWPFEGSSLVRYNRDKLPPARSFIQACSTAFDEWVDGDRNNLIDLSYKKNGTGDPLDLFQKEWSRQLDAVRRDPTCTPIHLQEERLYRGVLEAFRLSQAAGRETGGVRVRNLAGNMFPPTQSVERRWGSKVDLAAGAGFVSVVVAVTKLENTRKFRHYFEALERVSAAPVAGALLVHHRRDIPMGAGTQQAFSTAQKVGRLRFFPLEDYAETCAVLECLLQLLDKANSNELQLGGKTLSPDDCRDLVLKTHAIDNLDLFKALAGWRAPRAAAQAAPQVTAATSAAGAGTTHVAAAVVSATAGASVGSGGIAPPGNGDGAPPADGAPKDTGASRPMTPWAEGRLAELVKKLQTWNLPVDPEGVEVGSTFARLKVRPAGDKTSYKKVADKAVDLRIHLNLKIEPIISAQAGYISVDVQLPDRKVVPLADALARNPPADPAAPAFPVGQDVAGATHWLNLADPSDCHLLVAGTTGSGKSEFLRVMVAALAARLSHEQLQFVLIDPKRVTFNLAGESPYLRAPIAHDLDEALPLINECREETRRRYALLEERRLTDVSSLDPGLLPRIVIVIDEFAGLMEDKTTKRLMNDLLKQIGAMARAAGIHLVLATQRPDKDVVTPVLRDNLPGRVALKVASRASSELILNSPDAAFLLGKGDLFWRTGGSLIRLQSPLATQDDIETNLKMS